MSMLARFISNIMEWLSTIIVLSPMFFKAFVSDINIIIAIIFYYLFIKYITNHIENHLYHHTRPLIYTYMYITQNKTQVIFTSDAILSASNEPRLH